MKKSPAIFKLYAISIAVFSILVLYYVANIYNYFNPVAQIMDVFAEKESVYIYYKGADEPIKNQSIIVGKYTCQNTDSLLCLSYIQRKTSDNGEIQASVDLIGYLKDKYEKNQFNIGQYAFKIGDKWHYIDGYEENGNMQKIIYLNS